MIPFIAALAPGCRPETVAPPPEQPALRPLSDYESAPHGSVPRLSADGSVVAVWDFVRGVPTLFTGPSGDPDGLVPRAGLESPESRITWWDLTPDGGQALAVRDGGQLLKIGMDGRISVLGEAGGTPRFVVPLWDRGSLLIAVQEGEGSRVREWPLDGGPPEDRFSDPTADDVVFDGALRPRLSLERTRRHHGRGVFYDTVQVRSPEGLPWGDPFRQPAWVVDRDPVPRVGDEPVRMLGGGDRAGLGELDPRGFTPIWTPSWADATMLLLDPDGTVDGVGEAAERLRWVGGDPDAGELRWLEERLGADVRIDQRTPDDAWWVISSWSGSQLYRNGVFDRSSRTLVRFGRRYQGAADVIPYRPEEALVPGPITPIRALSAAGR